MYTDIQAQTILKTFLAKTTDFTITETELIECKTAANTFSDTDLGEYFSALSNEANLEDAPCAWLIFGITNKGTITGTRYLKDIRERNETKKKLADACTERYTFLDTHELLIDGKRVVMMEIPPAPKGIPIAFKGHYYARDGESLVPLSLQKLKLIASQLESDWSSVIIPDAGLDDLDEKAIAFARECYREKHPEHAEEMKTWDTITFLNKSKITLKGKITRAAVLLLGKPESEILLAPAQAKIKWILKNEQGMERDYYIATCPFILTANDIFQKIINLKYRYLQPGTLFQQEVDQYEPYIIKESLYNAIAHQDYTLNGAITVIQTEDTLRVTNPGWFIPGTVENVLINDSPETRTRNFLLSNAMVNYKMVDTIGSGIKKMFHLQIDKYFPLPEYSICDTKVDVLFCGRVLDAEYANRLMKDRSLSLSDIILLDKVQKLKELSEEELQYLRKKKLVSGRRPHIIISSSLAVSTDQKVEHARVRGLTTQGYETVIMESLKEYESLTRKEIDGILEKVLPENLSPEQKKSKVNHLLTKLRMDGKIQNTGCAVKPVWVLKKQV